MSNTLDRSEVDDRAEALERAVQHHGYANQAANAVPAPARTVLQTAKMFENYLVTGDVPEDTRTNGRH